MYSESAMIDAQAAADCFAEDAAVNSPQLFWGVWDLEDGLLLVFENYLRTPHPTVNLVDFSRWERLLNELGVRVVAKGHYGSETRSSDEPYTVTYLLEADKDCVNEVKALLQAEAESSQRSLTS